MSNFMKLPGHRPELPGNVISLILCPLTPRTARGLRGTLRPKQVKVVIPANLVLEILNRGAGIQTCPCKKQGTT